jgi:hypothetical protein
MRLHVDLHGTTIGEDQRQTPMCRFSGCRTSAFWVLFGRTPSVIRSAVVRDRTVLHHHSVDVFVAVVQLELAKDPTRHGVLECDGSGNKHEVLKRMRFGRYYECHVDDIHTKGCAAQVREGSQQGYLTYTARAEKCLQEV